MLTSEQIRAARAMLRIDQRKLADLSGVSLETIKRIELRPGVVNAFISTVQALQEALESAGIEFTNGDAPGVKLRIAPADTNGKPRRKNAPRRISRDDAEEGMAAVAC